jgi:hypothetical protein
MNLLGSFHGSELSAGFCLTCIESPKPNRNPPLHLPVTLNESHRRFPEPHTEEEEEVLYDQQLAWVQAIPLVAARKAKGKLPNPLDDDPLVARLKRDLLVVEKAVPRSAFSRLSGL